MKKKEKTKERSKERNKFQYHPGIFSSISNQTSAIFFAVLNYPLHKELSLSSKGTFAIIFDLYETTKQRHHLCVSNQIRKSKDFSAKRIRWSFTGQHVCFSQVFLLFFPLLFPFFLLFFASVFFCLIRFSYFSPFLLFSPFLWFFFSSLCFFLPIVHPFGFFSHLLLQKKRFERFYLKTSKKSLKTFFFSVSFFFHVSFLSQQQLPSVYQISYFLFISSSSHHIPFPKPLYHTNLQHNVHYYDYEHTTDDRLHSLHHLPAGRVCPTSGI